MITTALPTRNEEWGFFGTMASLDANTAQAWDVAFVAVATATGASPEGVRDFLDSRHGRRLADEVANGLHIGLELEAAIRLGVETDAGETPTPETANAADDATGAPEGAEADAPEPATPDGETAPYAATDAPRVRKTREGTKQAALIAIRVVSGSWWKFPSGVLRAL